MGSEGSVLERKNTLAACSGEQRFFIGAQLDYGAFVECIFCKGTKSIVCKFKNLPIIRAYKQAIFFNMKRCDDGFRFVGRDAVTVV